MKIVDDKSKKLRWNNRNFFWAVSILYCVLLILLFLPTAKNPVGIYTQRVTSINNSNFGVFGYMKEWVINFIGLYSHASWGHVLHNCLGFLLGAVYLERKYGSFDFFLILLGLNCLCSLGGGGIGNSYIWFALWGFCLVDFLWSLKKEKNKANIIFGSITLVLEYIRSGFYDKPSGGIGWSVVPHQLIYNFYHCKGFVFGILLCVIIRMVKFYINNK